MRLNGYFTSSAAAVAVLLVNRCRRRLRRCRSSSTVAMCSPPPSSLSAAVQVIHRHRCSPLSSVTFVYCIQRAEDIVKHVPQPHHSTFWPRAPVPDSKGTPSAVIKVMLTSSLAVGHSACQGIEHEHALSHYYVLPFIHIWLGLIVKHVTQLTLISVWSAWQAISGLYCTEL